MRTRDPGGPEDRKQNGGVRTTVGYPSSRPPCSNGETIRRSATETRRRKADRTALLRTAAPPRCTCGPLPAPPRPLPDPYTDPAPSRPALLEVAAASPRPLRLPDAAGQHPAVSGAAPPCRLRRGQEGRRDSSFGASLTRTPLRPLPTEPPQAEADALWGMFAPNRLFIAWPHPLPTPSPRLCVTSCLT